MTPVNTSWPCLHRVYKTTRHFLVNLFFRCFSYIQSLYTYRGYFESLVKLRCPSASASSLYYGWEMVQYLHIPLAIAQQREDKTINYGKNSQGMMLFKQNWKNLMEHAFLFDANTSHWYRNISTVTMAALANWRLETINEACVIFNDLWLLQWTQR